MNEFFYMGLAALALLALAIVGMWLSATTPFVIVGILLNVGGSLGFGMIAGTMWRIYKDYGDK